MHVYSDEMLKGFYETTKKVMERRSAENEMFGKVYASMMAFQEELAPWKEKGYLPRDWLSVNVYRAAVAAAPRRARAFRGARRSRPPGGAPAMSDYKVDIDLDAVEAASARGHALSFPQTAVSKAIDGFVTGSRRCSTGSG